MRLPPAFIIHSSTFSADRKSYVTALQEETGATLVEATLLDNRLIGCSLSHLKVAQLANQMYPDSSYIVFEDDCVLTSDWKDGLRDLSGDVCYLGYNDRGSDGILYGTHAMIISVKARQKILDYLPFLLQISSFPAYDHLCWSIWKGSFCTVGAPICGFLWAYQAKGILSLITGNPRR